MNPEEIQHQNYEDARTIKSKLKQIGDLIEDVHVLSEKLNSSNFGKDGKFILQCKTYLDDKDYEMALNRISYVDM